MENIKSWLRFHKREAVFGAVIFFVSSLSFGLGYLARRQYSHAPIVIEECAGIHQQAKTRL